MPALESLLAGAAQVAGNVVSNQMSSWQSDHIMDRQLEAANTAHQRQVKDLRAAGLNPILSAGDSGASGLNGSMPTVSDFGNTAREAVNSGLAIATAKENLSNTEMDTNLKKDQGSNLAAERVNIRKQTEIMSQQLQNQKYQNELLRETLPSMIKEAKAKGDWSQVNQIMGVINSGANSAGAVMGIGNSVKQLMNAVPSKLPTTTTKTESKGNK